MAGAPFPLSLRITRRPTGAAAFSVRAASSSSLYSVVGAIAPSRNEGSGSGFSDEGSCVARCCVHAAVALASLAGRIYARLLGDPLDR